MKQFRGVLTLKKEGQVGGKYKRLQGKETVYATYK